MRLLITGLAVLTLTACNSPAPPPAADNGGSPNEMTVESQLENEQIGEAQDIENDAAADNSNLDLDND